MRKTLLASSLLILLSSATYADNETTPVAAPAPAKTPETTTKLAAVPPIIDCHLQIPPTSPVPIDVVASWSEKAILQAFDYNNTNLDAQMNELKTCFTDQGWQGYNDALTQSGNMKAVKTQKLTVSGQAQGKAQASLVKGKENQWTVNMPLQVVYQNDTEKLTQILKIDLIVTRKVSGELGIAQIIAAPLGRPDAKTM
ncbi:MAG: DotI/IcmL family type IV secretion protein [Legionellaceae bacterium]|nr:DotI/IcmL family type IV secretion protein [Legionellaceae bacterium]